VHRLRGDLHGERILREVAEKQAAKPVAVEGERTYGYRNFSLNECLGNGSATVNDLACRARDLLADNGELRKQLADAQAMWLSCDRQRAEAQAQLAKSLARTADVERLYSQQEKRWEDAVVKTGVPRLEARVAELDAQLAASVPASRVRELAAGLEFLSKSHADFASAREAYAYAVGRLRELLPATPAAEPANRVYTEAEALEVMKANPCARFACDVLGADQPIVYRHNSVARVFWVAADQSWWESTFTEGPWHRLPDAATADEAPAAEPAKVERRPPFEWSDADKAKLVAGAKVEWIPYGTEPRKRVLVDWCDGRWIATDEDGDVLLGHCDPQSIVAPGSEVGGE
jgi:hypothetical protein